MCRDYSTETAEKSRHKRQQHSWGSRIPVIRGRRGTAPPSLDGPLRWWQGSRLTCFNSRPLQQNRLAPPNLNTTQVRPSRPSRTVEVSCHSSREENGKFHRVILVGVGGANKTRGDSSCCFAVNQTATEIRIRCLCILDTAVFWHFWVLGLWLKMLLTMPYFLPQIVDSGMWLD